MAVYLLEMFGISLLLTILIELPVLFLFGMRSRENALLALLVNVLTNPLAVLICWIMGIFFPGIPSMAVQIPIEAAVVAAEAFIYCRFAKEGHWEIRHPIALAASANACSWLFGVMLRAL